MTKKIIKNGIVIMPEGKKKADIYIEGESIKAVGINLATSYDTTVIDAEGCYVLPGIIDAHVQLEGKYKDTEMTDDFYTGTRAAVCGGITTIIDFAVQKQGGYSALEGLKQRRAQADPKVCTDYSLHVGITDPTDETLAEIKEIINEGITSFKCYMTYKERGRMVDEAGLYRAMDEIAKHNGIVEVHAENNTLVEYMTNKQISEGKTASKDFEASRTDICEQVATATAILLGKETGCDLYVHHVTSGMVKKIIEIAKSNGLSVYSETCPQYLLLDDSVYQEENGQRYIMNPPIRGKDSQKIIWEGMEDGTIDTVGTDHCSYTIAHKDENKDVFYKVAAGVPGLETLLSTVYTYGVATNKITIERLSEVLSTNPARIFGLTNKGLIKEGYDADIVIYDPTGVSQVKASDLNMSTDLNPFEGMKIEGSVIMTMLRGKEIYQNGQFIGEKGQGKFINGKRNEI